MSDYIEVKIGNKKYQLDASDAQSIRDIPWSDRKQLIEILTAIKQADHIKPKEPPEKIEQKLLEQEGPPKLGPTVKANDEDIDAMMNRLIMESGGRRNNIPEKGQVYKWLGVTVLVIIVLSRLF